MPTFSAHDNKWYHNRTCENSKFRKFLVKAKQSFMVLLLTSYSASSEAGPIPDIQSISREENAKKSRTDGYNHTGRATDHFSAELGD